MNDFHGNKIRKKGSWRVFVAKLMNCTYYFRHQEPLKILSKEVAHLEVNKQFHSGYIVTGL